jgi:hypothetical protein
VLGETPSLHRCLIQRRTTASEAFVSWWTSSLQAAMHMSLWHVDGGTSSCCLRPRSTASPRQMAPIDVVDNDKRQWYVISLKLFTCGPNCIDSVLCQHVVVLVWKKKCFINVKNSYLLLCLSKIYKPYITRNLEKNRIQFYRNVDAFQESLTLKNKVKVLNYIAKMMIKICLFTTTMIKFT